MSGQEELAGDLGKQTSRRASKSSGEGKRLGRARWGSLEGERGGEGRGGLI